MSQRSNFFIPKRVRESCTSSSFTIPLTLDLYISISQFLLSHVNVDSGAAAVLLSCAARAEPQGLVVPSSPDIIILDNNDYDDDDENDDGQGYKKGGAAATSRRGLQETKEMRKLSKPMLFFVFERSHGSIQ